ncbi:MAG: hypothetical protein A2Y75_05430 [Candidatus Solincola sediminis]|uniref:Uncharacterized protein n=1 Tax=Candidatus Solincola sediminis TaxID=1797199 RepID=A0A1F2WG89_9ACTN|nr:MAG: hypothetical protein A2Y75_05430 [Candidatus Solincola sediminis]
MCKHIRITYRVVATAEYPIDEDYYEGMTSAEAKAFEDDPKRLDEHCESLICELQEGTAKLRVTTEIFDKE